MDADRFDCFARSLTTTRSRRGALAALLGGPLGLLGLAGTAAKKKKKKKKKKGQGNTSQNPVSPPPPPPPPPPPCQGQTDGAVCGAGRICAQGQCVTGQGTCAAGANACTGSAPCGSANCFCFTTMANQTRCGINSPLSGCDTCANDAACAALFPNTPGVFCFQDTGDNCACGGRCMAPCGSPTCTDGIKNGSESDIDCGGACPRCANSKSCATRNDCAGAFCKGGTCHACAVNSECGFDGNGECYCVTPETGGSRVCITGDATPDDYVQSCTACPTGTIYCSGPFGPTEDGYLCYMPCGAP